MKKTSEIVVIDGQSPITQRASASDIVILAGIEDRHQNAIGFELRRAPMEALIQLAYHEHAEPRFLGEVPDWLASAAYDEIERRQGAVRQLLKDCPTLAARVCG